ncbi:hypothetical protein Sjap_018319 [Stephania japonica]|uniref:Zinc-finger domain-containing protein n=1 Tax=Stephania japonica TaxID=461633 RepID=A0AAP0NL02_9MAGN
MRYGENVLEANKNPDWICPVCRGICNCSLCRQAKGWPPTGSLYRKISRLGFKSVAHYLIQTRRPQTNSKNTCIDPAASARRTLPFAKAGGDIECKDYASADNTLCEAQKIEFEDGENNDEIKGEEDESLNLESDPNIDAEENSECKGSLVADNCQPEELETGFEYGKSNHETNTEEDESLYLHSKLGIKDAVVEHDSNGDAEENSECKDSPIADSSQDKRNHTKPPNFSSSPLFSSLPPRRSSRLQNVTPVNYSEKLVKKKNTEADANALGLNPEIYTEEQEKLLGSCEEGWTLFVDGYGSDGKRIYDPVKGKTCHQCRLKSLGHLTRCSKCNLVQGQFCCDCLYMR